MYLIQVSESTSATNNFACCGLEPPLPHTYKFHPFSVAMIPKSFPCASAHSRMQPLTPPFNLCGARRPRYLSSISIANDTLSCKPKRHQVLPTQLFTVRKALPYA